MCGGTGIAFHVDRGNSGLSPRVRGNLRSDRHKNRESGSIPACAGEPKSGQSKDCENGVYPRVCGGTLRPDCFGFLSAGLSPRVRGNPCMAQKSRWPSGSIPACAGEPSLFAGQGLQNKVYPRVCGGTRVRIDNGFTHRGLSPRVRGNHPPGSAAGRRCGSIPACAGEPCLMGRSRLVARVYPRVCGGTR